MHVLIYSIALILIIGFLFSSLFIRLQLPGLLGLILTGILLGPFGMDLMAPELLAISLDIQIALIVILVRAGLTMELGDLKKIGRPAILMTFFACNFRDLGCHLVGAEIIGHHVIGVRHPWYCSGCSITGCRCPAYDHVDRKRLRQG